MLSFNVDASVDQKTYWGLAHFDFNQISVRKYRVIIPFLAAGINRVLVSLVHLARPGALTGDFSLKSSFFLINLPLTALWCTLVYAFIRTFKVGRTAALIGMMAVVTSKWTILNAATPMVDSLYCCTVGLALLGIRTRNAAMIFWAVIIGPFAKESFLFMVPVILFFSPVPAKKLLAWLALSALLVFSYRYVFDSLTGHPMIDSLGDDAAHVTYLAEHFRRFLDTGFLNDIIATTGLWWAVPVIAGWRNAMFRKGLRQGWKPFMGMYLLMVFCQMILSGDLARMLYLAMPVYGWIISVSADYFIHPSREHKGELLS